MHLLPLNELTEQLVSINFSIASILCVYVHVFMSIYEIALEKHEMLYLFNRSQSGGEEACDVQKARRSRQSRMPQRSLSFAGASRHSFQRVRRTS